MKALVLDPKPTLHSDYALPRIHQAESLVRVIMAGICRTDLELARGYMGFHGVPGHEFVGEVVESREASMHGRKVVGEINAGCGSCRLCIDGMERHCPNRTVLGILGRDGAFAEYLALPDRNLLLVPSSMPDELAVFVEPVAAAYEILEQVKLARNQSVLILGDGRLGALIGLVLWSEGYDPVVGGHHQGKLELLGGLGLKVALEEDLQPGFDTVIDCTGTSRGFMRGVEMVRPRGRIILKSTAAAAADMNLAPIVINEINIVGSRCGRFAPAIDAIASGRIDPRPLISAMYPLDEAVTALEAAADTRNFKILLKM